MTLVYSKPKASIILPVKNGEATIGLSIESLLAQKEANIEILVIDNGSEDLTLEILSGYKDHSLQSYALLHLLNLRI